MPAAQLAQPVQMELALSPPSFHPTLTIRSSTNGTGTQLDSEAPASSSCLPSLRISIDIPEGLFVDPDELDDRFVNFGVTRWDLRPCVNGAGARTSGGGGSGGGSAGGVQGAEGDIRRTKVDIERPSLDLTSDECLALDVAILAASVTGGRTEWLLEVPFHARYLPPTESGTTAIQLPTEDGLRAGWACSLGTQRGQDEDMAVLPLAPVHPVRIILPTGKMSHQPLVETVTTLVIWLGWAWLVYKILKVRTRASSTKGRGESRTN
ncbi:hypothetical protein IAU60_006693 [Kwoniella sp. DSM 27419]